VERDKLLIEVDATLLPGVYEVAGGWDTSTITNAQLDDVYTVYPFQTTPTNASLPGPSEIITNNWLFRDRVVQGWVDIPGTVGTGSLDAEFFVERNDEQVNLSSSPTLDLTLLVNGLPVFTTLGLVPDGSGFWRTSIPHTEFTPTEGTLIIAVATVNSSSDTIVGTSILSIPKFV
jgi:hypothetical protein